MSHFLECLTGGSEKSTCAVSPGPEERMVPVVSPIWTNSYPFHATSPRADARGDGVSSVGFFRFLSFAVDAIGGKDNRKIHAINCTIAVQITFTLLARNRRA